MLKIQVGEGESEPEREREIEEKKENILEKTGVGEKKRVHLKLPSHQVG